MGRISFSLSSLLFLFSLFPIQAEGDISFDIKNGACWKATPQSISFLKMEGYVEKARETLYHFPNPRATLGNWPLGDITLSVDRRSKQPNAFYINIYDSEKTSQPLTMDIFTPMLMSIVQSLNVNYQIAGRLSPDKTVYQWDTIEGSARLSFQTIKGTDGKQVPQNMRLIFSKRGYMPTARKEAETTFNGFIPSHDTQSGNSTETQDIDTPTGKLSKAQLKAKVSSSPDSVYITDFPSIPRAHGSALQMNIALAVLKHYGYPDIDNDTAQALAKEVELAIQVNRHKPGGSSRNEQEMDFVIKILRNKYQIRAFFPERVTEGKETGALIKRCDREQKTPVFRSEFDVSFNILFKYEEATLIKVRSSLPANNDRWFKTVKEYIDQGIPIIWRLHDNYITTRLIVGYHPTLKDIIYVGSNGELAHVPLDKAMAYTISQTIIYP